MCELCVATGRTTELPYAAGFSCDDGSGPAANPDIDGSAITSAPLPVFSNNQIADQLTQETSGGAQIAFDAKPGDTITVDITGLTNAGKFLATNALEAWENVTGLNFAFVSSGAKITFDDENSGAYASYSWRSNGDLVFADVNVSKGWLNAYGTSINSYSFQTYIHEIGHALGLRHAGNYNGSATYGVDNHYLNDSWQATVMSYFSQTENTYIDASFAYVITPMVADIVAIQDLYGTPTNIRTGATVYGNNSNAGGYLETFFESNQTAAMTIYDNGGTDLFDFSHYSANQLINLNQEAISNVGGLTGNLIVARGTVIENAVGGSGRDELVGNTANNVLKGNGGNDVLRGGLGNDNLQGGSGNDLLQGGAGNDTLTGANGLDRLVGQGGNDTLRGGVGRDAVWGGAGNDTIYYGAGDYFWKGDGTPKNIGGPGTDKLIVEAGAKFTTSNLSWYGFEAFQGAEKGDQVTGGNANVNYWLNGEGGNDVLKGSGGTDTLIGGTGNDTLTPGGSSGGVQKLQGGAGNDTYVITSNGGRIEIVELAGNGNDKLTFKDLNRSEVEVSLDGDGDMVLSWDGGAGEVSINDAGDNVEQFVFQNGQVFGPDDFAFV
ncbi:M10 family metallopeptidase [Roseibium sp. MMSF_3544]|uniref:M10 family metallopeptidase n=1 Tax=unclassified Roseibium TaxID=2629323 RepID=UPI00273F4D87|nr:M10 family metallopeptidase [Roseibium sp. MMSF_3544]